MRLAQETLATVVRETSALRSKPSQLLRGEV